MVLMSHAGVDNQVDADEIAKLEQAKKRLEDWKSWGPSGPPVIDLDVQSFLIPFFSIINWLMKHVPTFAQTLDP